jgi:DNA-directed RNA polymerase subunit beta
MAYTENKVTRTYVGKDYKEAIELPDLIDIQLSSYERFLQRAKHEQRRRSGALWP